MNILVIDAQGGGVGKQLVTAIKQTIPHVLVTAVGTNSAATSAMLKAGGRQCGDGRKCRHGRLPQGQMDLWAP